MSPQTHSNQPDAEATQKHECPLCGESITISDVFHSKRCPGCDSTLEEMQAAASDP